MKDQNIFEIQFLFLNKTYQAKILPTYLLTNEEIITYNIQKHSFLVHLMVFSDSHYFELFVDDDLEWNTNSHDKVVTDELVQYLGRYIDQHTM